MSFGSQIPVVGLAVLMPVILTGAGQLDGNAQRPNVAIQQDPNVNNTPFQVEEPPPPMVMPPGPLPAPGPFRGGPPPGTGRIPFAAPFRGGPPPGTGRIPFAGRPAFPRIQTPDQQLKRIVEGHGDRAVAIVVLGLPRNSDPDKGVTARDVSQAINKQLRELEPGATEFLSIGGTDRTKILMAPIDDKQGLAKRIGFGKVVVVKTDLFEVTVSPDFIASVPRLPAEQQVAATDIGPSTREPEPKIPDGADAITKSLIQLKSHDKGKQKEAIQRLERTAPDEREDEVVAALLPLLEDDDGFLVNDVIKALEVWQTPEVVPALIQRTKDNRFFVRHEAIKALGKSKDVRGRAAHRALQGRRLPVRGRPESARFHRRTRLDHATEGRGCRDPPKGLQHPQGGRWSRHAQSNGRDATGSRLWHSRCRQRGVQGDRVAGGTVARLEKVKQDRIGHTRQEVIHVLQMPHYERERVVLYAAARETSYRRRSGAGNGLAGRAGDSGCAYGFRRTNGLPSSRTCRSTTLENAHTLSVSKNSHSAASVDRPETYV